MARVSERIDHHVLKAAHSIKHTIKQNANKRPIYLSLGVIALICVVLAAFFIERYNASHQNELKVTSCDTLFFSANEKICDKTIHQIFAPLHPLSRKPLCDRREHISSAEQLCMEYDDARRIELYGVILDEYGIAPWEPSQNITASKMLIRTKNLASSVTLVCDNRIITAVQPTNTSLTLELPALHTNCSLIATAKGNTYTSPQFFVNNK